MQKPVTSAPRQTRLADMGVVRVQGADAVKFLQGQVSNDVAELSAEFAVLAGLHNAQGRAIALLRLVLASDDEVLAILPRELASVVATRLAKFVLRAKVKVSDASLEWGITGVEGAPVAGEMGIASIGAARRDEDRSVWVCVGLMPERWLVMNPAGTHAAPPETMSRDEWRALDIADGVPQVYAATSEAFVAQMLNLDVVGGIAFDKGCYTGQEVIARAHYRGKVKRRMQRFQTTAAPNLKPGDSGTLGDGRSFKVVDAVQLAHGGCEFLAVTTLGHASEEAAEETTNPALLDARPLELPYSLPA